MIQKDAEVIFVCTQCFFHMKVYLLLLTICYEFNLRRRAMSYHAVWGNNEVACHKMFLFIATVKQSLPSRRTPYRVRCSVNNSNTSRKPIPMPSPASPFIRSWPFYFTRKTSSITEWYHVLHSYTDVTYINSEHRSKCLQAWVSSKPC